MMKFIDAIFKNFASLTDMTVSNVLSDCDLII